MFSRRLAWILPVAFALLAAGCVSPHKISVVAPEAKPTETAPRINPTEAALAAGEATLELNRRPRTLPFYVARIDGPESRQELTMTPVEGFYRLQAGLNAVTVKTYVSDYRGLPAGSEAPGATLHFLAIPGFAYTLSAVNDGNTLSFSIIERNTLRTVVDGATLPIFRPASADSSLRWDPTHAPAPIPAK